MIVYMNSATATRDEVLQSYLDHGHSREDAELYTSIYMGDDEAGDPGKTGQID